MYVCMYVCVYVYIRRFRGVGSRGARGQLQGSRFGCEDFLRQVSIAPPAKKSLPMPLRLFHSHKGYIAYIASIGQRARAYCPQLI